MGKSHYRADNFQFPTSNFDSRKLEIGIRLPTSRQPDIIDVRPHSSTDIIATGFDGPRSCGYHRNVSLVAQQTSLPVGLWPRRAQVSWARGAYSDRVGGKAGTMRELRVPGGMSEITRRSPQCDLADSVFQDPKAPTMALQCEDSTP